MKLTEEGIVFPLKERYNHDAGTLEGIEASTHYKDGQQHGLLPEPPDNGDDVRPVRRQGPRDVAHRSRPSIARHKAISGFSQNASENQRVIMESAKASTPPARTAAMRSSHRAG